jgi:hypothetical protein
MLSIIQGAEYKACFLLDSESIGLGLGNGLGCDPKIARRVSAPMVASS